MPPTSVIAASRGFILDPIAVGELTVFQVEEMLPEFVMKPYRAGSRHYMSMSIVSLK